MRQTLSQAHFWRDLAAGVDRPRRPGVRRQSRPAAAGSASLQNALGGPPLVPNRSIRTSWDDGRRGASEIGDHPGRIALNPARARQRYGSGLSRLAGTLSSVIVQQPASYCRPQRPQHPLGATRGCRRSNRADGGAGPAVKPGEW